MRIERAFAANPDAGMAGLYDRLCDGQPRDQTSFQKCSKARQPCRDLAAPSHSRSIPHAPFLRTRGTIRSQIREAIAAGYRPAEFILGGAYAVSGEAIRRMKAKGCFGDPLLWLHTHFSEDVR